MSNRQQKSECIPIRTTPEEKAWIHDMAKQSGVTVTAFLLTTARSHVFVSPLMGRQVVQLLHSIYYQLQDIQSKDVNVGEMQEALNDCTCLLRNQINELKTLNGGDQKCPF